MKRSTQENGRKLWYLLIDINVLVEAPQTKNPERLVTSYNSILKALMDFLLICQFSFYYSILECFAMFYNANLQFIFTLINTRFFDHRYKGTIYGQAHCLMVHSTFY